MAPARIEGRIQACELVDQYADRPAVRSDVVHADHEHVALQRQRDDADAQHQVGGQIERRARLGDHEFAQRLILRCGGEFAAVEIAHRQRAGGLHLLPAGAVVLDVDGAQHVVPRKDGVQCLLQGFAVEATVQFETRADVVLRRGAFELIDEPQALLRERQRLQEPRRRLADALHRLLLPTLLRAALQQLDQGVLVAPYRIGNVAGDRALRRVGPELRTVQRDFDAVLVQHVEQLKNRHCYHSISSRSSSLRPSPAGTSATRASMNRASSAIV